MSTEDRDAILGRVLREHAEAKKTVVALYSEVERIGNYLTTLGHALRSKHNLDASGFGMERGFIDLRLFPTESQIRDLVTQVQEAELLKAQLAHRLREAGYEPKE